MRDADDPTVSGPSFGGFTSAAAPLGSASTLPSGAVSTPIVTPPEKYTLSALEEEDLTRRFTYHSPKSDQPARYERLRSQAHDLAKTIVKSTPKNREQWLALTHLETAIFYANAAIARHE